MAGGRPTVATPENVDKAWEYVKECEAKGGLPTVEQLAYTIDISKDTLYERDEFSDVMARLKNIQGHMLITAGLNGDYNPTIAKLLLSAKHGYVEKTATDLTTKGESINVEPDPKLAAEFTAFMKERNV